MNKILNVNSFFTKIILAVLSFAVIVCIFIPYLRVPAVESVQDVDTVNFTLDRKIGKNQSTFNISEFTSSSAPAFELYKDEALTETVDKSKVPLNGDTCTYYFATYAYGYNVENKKEGLKTNLIKVYTVTFNKDVKNNSQVRVERNIADATITIRVPKATTFDFARVIDTKTAWLKQDTKMAQQFSSIDGKELKSIALDPGAAVSYYAAITLKSEVDPTAKLLGKPEENSGPVYLPLDIFTLTVERDAERNTLPVVGEIGGSVMSKEVNGKMEFYDDDIFMFAFMILGAMSALFAFIIPNKFKLIELVIAEIMGIGLVILPILDMSFYTSYGFLVDPGVYILIVLGVLIMLVAVWDYLRCTAEYKAEMIHIYGEDYFDPARKAAIKAEFKAKDIAYKAELKANKEALKAEKKAGKAAK